MQSTIQDTRVSDAINRVLEAEQNTAAAIARAQADAQATIEAARERRRTILETARDRVVRLHDRAQARLEDKLRRLDAAADAASANDSTLAAVTDAAIARVASRLTSDGVT